MLPPRVNSAFAMVVAENPQTTFHSFLRPLPVYREAGLQRQAFCVVAFVCSPLVIGLAMLRIDRQKDVKHENVRDLVRCIDRQCRQVLRKSKITTWGVPARSCERERRERINVTNLWQSAH